MPAHNGSCKPTPCRPHRGLGLLLLAALALPLGGCQGMYFRDAGPAPVIRHELASLPYSEYWTGIVFNGEKIGFAHFDIRKADAGQYEIRSEASFALRFLGIEKKINLKSRDLIRDDLALVEFAYQYQIDGSELRVSGRREPRELVATIVTAGKPTEQRLPVEGKLYSSSVIILYPVLQGLEIGREYSFDVYSGEIQAIAEVTQRVTAWQQSELFTGNAFKVETAMRGQRVSTWIGPDGRPVFELALHGAMISFLEDAGSANRYLALASLNKKEGLIEYSMVKPDRRIPDPRSVSALRVSMEGVDRVPPSDAAQQCTASRQDIACEMKRGSRNAGNDVPVPLEPAEARYLRPSVTVQSNDPAIRRV